MSRYRCSRTLSDADKKALWELFDSCISEPYVELFRCAFCLQDFDPKTEGTLHEGGRCERAQDDHK
jgi:hypothetical protein